MSYKCALLCSAIMLLTSYVFADQTQFDKHLNEENIIFTSNELPFSDNANRPANIGPGTVITTDSHGMWVVIDGDYYAGSQRYEKAYFYENNNSVIMSYMSCGVSFTVIEMPDKSPIVSYTTTPGNMNPGTVIMLENGQVWRITNGSYYQGFVEREEVIVYLMNEAYHMSFQKCGVTMDVELISSVTPTNQIGANPGLVQINLSANENVNLLINTTNNRGDVPLYQWFLFTEAIGGSMLPIYVLANSGVFDLNQVMSSLSDYTFSFDKSGLTNIGTMSMSDLGLKSGDTLFYCYMYMNGSRNIFVDNIVIITVN